MIKHPEFAMRLIKTLIHRTRGLLNSVRSLSSLDVFGRVARLLLELATEEDGKLVINGKLTKQDIANRVGASREMTSARRSRTSRQSCSRTCCLGEDDHATDIQPQHW